jgi:hypothetical protein
MGAARVILSARQANMRTMRDANSASLMTLGSILTKSRLQSCRSDEGLVTSTPSTESVDMGISEVQKGSSGELGWVHFGRWWGVYG